MLRLVQRNSCVSLFRQNEAKTDARQLLHGHHLQGSQRAKACLRSFRLIEKTPQTHSPISEKSNARAKRA